MIDKAAIGKTRAITRRMRRIVRRMRRIVRRMRRIVRMRAIMRRMRAVVKIARMARKAKKREMRIVKRKMSRISLVKRSRNSNPQLENHKMVRMASWNLIKTSPEITQFVIFIYVIYIFT
jgi:hypothetical protein